MVMFDITFFIWHDVFLAYIALCYSSFPTEVTGIDRTLNDRVYFSLAVMIYIDKTMNINL